MKKLIYVIGIVALLSSRIASANAVFHDAMEQVNSSFAAGFNFMRFNYVEDVRDAARDLDRIPPPGDVKNYGNAYGLMIQFRNLFYEWLHTEIAGEYATGKIKYDGYHQYTYEVRKYKKAQHFFNVDTKLGVLVFTSKYFQVIPYVGFGYHYWGASPNYNYSHYKPIVGGKLNFSFYDTLVLSPYVNVGKTLAARAKAKLYNRDGNFVNDVKYKLGGKNIQEFGLELNYRLDNEIFFTAMVSHTHFEYGKSGIVQSSIEPSSETNELRIGIGIRIGFR